MLLELYSRSAVYASVTMAPITLLPLEAPSRPSRDGFSRSVLQRYNGVAPLHRPATAQGHMFPGIAIHASHGNESSPRTTSEHEPRRDAGQTPSDMGPVTTRTDATVFFAAANPCSSSASVSHLIDILRAISLLFE